MAVTRLRRIKEASGRNKAVHLKKNIFYICNDEKTDGGIWIGGNAGLSPQVVYRTMIQNKQVWGKLDGTQGFAYVISFPPDCGVKEETVYRIAEEFCRELLGDDYYYVFAVHNDKTHMHAHITFEAVSRKDGKKFHSPKGDWERRIQPITDRLCEKYHLPILEFDEERRHRSYAEWKHEKTPEDQFYTWHDIIRDDIDEAIQSAQSYEDFISFLKKNGYTVTRDGKCLSLKPCGREQAVRTGRLGNGYEKEEIIRRISDREKLPQALIRYKTYGNREEMREIIYAKIEHSPGWKMTPLQRNFWRRWNNTYFVRKPQLMTKDERARRRQDITEIQKLSDAIRYMVDYDIGTVSDLGKRGSILDEELEALSLELAACRTKYYKKQPFYLLSQYEKLKENDPSGSSVEIQEEMNRILKKIENVCPYEEAVLKRQELKEKIDGLRVLLNDGKKEKKLIDEIFRLYYQMEPETLQNNVPLRENAPIGRETNRNMEVNKDGTGEEKYGESEYPQEKGRT